MFLNSWRMRLGLIAAGVLLTGAYLIFGGRPLLGADTGVLIEFGADPDRFAGMDVEVDGRIVGKREADPRVPVLTAPGDRPPYLPSFPLLPLRRTLCSTRQTGGPVKRLSVLIAVLVFLGTVSPIRAESDSTAAKVFRIDGKLPGEAGYPLQD